MDFYKNGPILALFYSFIFCLSKRSFLPFHPKYVISGLLKQLIFYLSNRDFLRFQNYENF